MIASTTPCRYACIALSATPSVACRQAGATSSRSGTVARSAWTSAIPRTIPGVATVPRPMWNSCRGGAEVRHQPDRTRRPRMGGDGAGSARRSRRPGGRSPAGTASRKPPPPGEESTGSATKLVASAAMTASYALPPRAEHVLRGPRRSAHGPAATTLLILEPPPGGRPTTRSNVSGSVAPSLPMAITREASSRPMASRNPESSAAATSPATASLRMLTESPTTSSRCDGLQAYEGRAPGRTPARAAPASLPAVRWRTKGEAVRTRSSGRRAQGRPWRRRLDDSDRVALRFERRADFEHVREELRPGGPVIGAPGGEAIRFRSRRAVQMEWLAEFGGWFGLGRSGVRRSGLRPALPLPVQRIASQDAALRATRPAVEGQSRSDSSGCRPCSDRSRHGRRRSIRPTRSTSGHCARSARISPRVRRRSAVHPARPRSRRTSKRCWTAARIPPQRVHAQRLPRPHPRALRPGRPPRAGQKPRPMGDRRHGTGSTPSGPPARADPPARGACAAADAGERSGAGQGRTRPRPRPEAKIGGMTRRPPEVGSNA